MLLQCRTLVLNYVKVSHNEAHAFGSEPCRLFQLALHVVFYRDFFDSIFPVTLMHAGQCQLVHTGLRQQTPPLCSHTAALCSLLPGLPSELFSGWLQLRVFLFVCLFVCLFFRRMKDS